MGRIEIPMTWDRLRFRSPPQPYDPEYDIRIKRAAEALRDTTFNDNIQLVHRTLLDHGLVPLTNLNAQTSSMQTLKARAVVQLAHIGGASIVIGTESLSVQHSELILCKAAFHFNIEIILFSSRKTVHRYKPPSNVRFSIALLHLKDQFTSMSQLLVLVRSRTQPSPRVLLPPKAGIPPPTPMYPPAVRHTEPRERSYHRYDHTDDVRAFHLAW